MQDKAMQKRSMQNNGLVEVASRHSVEETVNRLKSLFAEKGLQIFALIDHSGEAEKVGMKMRPTKVLIFGSPKGGTPLMLAAPSLAIDLPLKALVSEDESGKVWVTYNAPEYLQQRHGVPDDLIKNIAGAGALITKAVE
jgi:uncharacterized protein (DUF302 family)